MLTHPARIVGQWRMPVDMRQIVRPFVVQAEAQIGRQKAQPQFGAGEQPGDQQQGGLGPDKDVQRDEHPAQIPGVCVVTTMVACHVQVQAPPKNSTSHRTTFYVPSGPAEPPR